MSVTRYKAEERKQEELERAFEQFRRDLDKLQRAMLGAQHYNWVVRNLKQLSRDEQIELFNALVLELGAT